MQIAGYVNQKWERGRGKHTSEVLNIQRKDAAISLKGNKHKRGFNIRGNQKSLWSISSDRAVIVENPVN